MYYTTKQKLVEYFYDESVGSENWETCDGHCIDLNRYEFPDSIQEKIDNDPEWEHNHLAHYFIHDADGLVIEDRLFLFQDDEPVAVFIRCY